MADLNDALSRWKALLGEFQKGQTYRSALTGDGSNASTADVTGRPGWAWVRYDEKQDKASQVVNWRYPGIGQDVPVMVGRQYPTDRFYQILGVNLDLYLENMTSGGLVSYILPKHGNSHHGATGNDPAPVDLRNLVFGRVGADSPESLFVNVTAFSYDSDGEYATYGGGLTDLTSSVPATTGYHAYTLIALDTGADAIVTDDGPAVPVAMSPEIPDVDAGWIPLAIVRLENGATEIYESDIFDYRVVLTAIGGNLDVINNIVGTLESEIDYLLTQHMMLIQANKWGLWYEEAERDFDMSKHVVEG